MLETKDFKVPPHSIEAEQSVLGGLMLDNLAWERIADLISEKDFYRPDHRLIFQQMMELTQQNAPLDIITLSDALESHDHLEKVGGIAYLGELAKNTPSAVNIQAYAEIVAERALMRKLVNIASDIAESAYNPEGRSSREVISEVESKVFQLAKEREEAGRPVDVKSILPEVIDRIDTLFHSGNSITGTPTGFDDLDQMTFGLQEADLVVVAGRPSMGKTVLGVNIAENVALNGDKPVLIFSMEMPSSSIIMRNISSLGRVDQAKLRSGQFEDADWPKISAAMSRLTEKNQLYIDEQGSLSPTELRSRARQLSREKGQLGLIVIDYLQLMKVPGLEDNRTAEISEISRSLKALAKELNVPVIALSQLNRSLEQRADKRPVMSDLRESGAIEQDADLILFIYRDEVYNPESPEKGVAEIIIGKQRNGPIGTIRLTFQGRYTRFDNYLPNIDEV